MGSRTVDNSSKRAYNKWTLTKTLWPKQCALTGLRIPMYSKAYYRKDGRFEIWVSADEFIMARLRGDI